jgi:uncharacterized phage protein gp47/JayE
LIDFSNDTYQNILSLMLNKVPNTFDKREGGIIQTALGPAAYALEEYYAALNQVQRTAFVQTAVGQSLDYLAVIAGIARYTASAAVRLGVFNKPIPLGSRFSTINGADSINFISTKATSNPNEFELTAETPGTIGNAYSGSILPISYIDGLTSAQITDILVPGDDTETDDEFRERLIIALNEKPFGGNVAAYRSYIGEIDGVGAIQVYPTWNGGGTVKCSIIGADFEPASETLVNNVQNAVDPPPNQGLGLGMAPIGAKVTVVTPTAIMVNVSANITLASGYDIGQVQPIIEEAIGAYLLGIRQKWGTPVTAGGIEYSANVYRAQVIAAIVGSSGVLNATDVKLNAAEADIILTETGTVQQVPKMGTVTLVEA